MPGNSFRGLKHILRDSILRESDASDPEILHIVQNVAVCVLGGWEENVLDSL